MYKLLNIILIFLFIVADCNAGSVSTNVHNVRQEWNQSYDPRCVKRKERAPYGWVCKVAMESWYYDLEKYECVFTSIGECGETSDNFYTEHECAIACMHEEYKNI